MRASFGCPLLRLMPSWGKLYLTWASRSQEAKTTEAQRTQRKVVRDTASSAMYIVILLFVWIAALSAGNVLYGLRGR
jgi:hypothetical protein